MGTRADFYVLDQNEYIWCGSIEWDGHEDKVPKKITQSGSVDEFLEEVDRFLIRRNDGVTPDKGWPHAWKSSQLTDYSYIFLPNRGMVYISHLGGQTYTIFDHNSFQKRYKKALKDDTDLPDWELYLAKLKNFTPAFPLMKK